MSWTLTYPNGVRRNSSLDDLNKNEVIGDLSEEGLEQVRQAKVMANSIIVSGAVGNGDKVYYVNLSGHANPNHEPKEGWANDMITVSVAQKSREE
jgi:hypothetical protein